MRRVGLALLGTTIGILLINFVIKVLKNSIFTKIPYYLIQPIVRILMGISYFALMVALETLLFGQKAVDQAKGQLSTDEIKGLLRLLFW